MTNSLRENELPQEWENNNKDALLTYLEQVGSEFLHSRLPESLLTGLFSVLTYSQQGGLLRSG